MDIDEELPAINIGDTDENADWILTPERRAEELAIHDELAKKAREGQGPEAPGTRTRRENMVSKKEKRSLSRPKGKGRVELILGRPKGTTEADLRELAEAMYQEMVDKGWVKQEPSGNDDDERQVPVQGTTPDEARALIDGVLRTHGLDPEQATDEHGWRHLMLGWTQSLVGVAEQEKGEHHLVVLAPVARIPTHGGQFWGFYKMLLELNYYATSSAHFCLHDDTSLSVSHARSMDWQRKGWIARFKLSHL